MLQIQLPGLAALVSKNKKIQSSENACWIFLSFYPRVAIVSVVESEGFEPSSKRVLLQPSTCLVFV